MTPKRIAEIRAACEAATPGHWEADLSPGSDPDEGYPNHGWVWPPKTYSDSSGDYMLWEDVQFCVLARDAVPELLAEVERLRAELKSIETQFNLVCELEDQHLCLPDPECEHCGKPASCLGAYEGAPEAWACDECCSHSNEDGHCVMVRDLPRLVEGLRGLALCSGIGGLELGLHRLEAENARLRAKLEALRAERDAVRAEEERLRAEAQTEMPEEVSIEVLQLREQPCQGCGITNKPLNRRFLCGGCLAIIGLTAENARLRAKLEERAVAKLEARLALADQLADWIEGRVDSDHPEACAGRHCICQTLAAYRASAEVLS